MKVGLIDKDTTQKVDSESKITSIFEDDLRQAQGS